MIVTVVTATALRFSSSLKANLLPSSPSDLELTDLPLFPEDVNHDSSTSSYHQVLTSEVSGYLEEHHVDTSREHLSELSAAGHAPEASLIHSPDDSQNHGYFLSQRGHSPVLSNLHSETVSEGHGFYSSIQGHLPSISQQGEPHRTDYSSTHDFYASVRHDEFLTQGGHLPSFSGAHNTTVSGQHDPYLTDNGHAPALSAESERPAPDPSSTPII